MPRPILHQPGTVSQEKGGARGVQTRKADPSKVEATLVETDYDPRPPVVGLAAKRFLNASR
jgi:hypothetical protein